MGSAVPLIHQHRFADGSRVETVTLTNDQGLTARVATFGATLIALETPDRDGTIDDIVLGHDTIDDYVGQRHYFGSTVGRYANRIAHARFAIAGRDLVLTANEGDHHLHGGNQGFDRLPWTIGAVTSVAVTLDLLSPDGDEGYPGAVSATATFTLGGDTLTIDYRATTTAPTIVNLTNHSVFNLAGSRVRRDAMDHRLRIDAHFFTPVDDAMIPVGGPVCVAGTPFDFRASTPIGSRIRDADVQLRHGHGYDHNFIVDGAPDTLRSAARLEDPGSGRVLELLQTAPGLHFYAGNHLDGAIMGKRDRLYRQGDGIALEPQLFPDSPNRSDFPPAVLMPGETYRSTIVFRLSASAPTVEMMP